MLVASKNACLCVQDGGGIGVAMAGRVACMPVAYGMWDAVVEPRPSSSGHSCPGTTRHVENRPDLFLAAYCWWIRRRHLPSFQPQLLEASPSHRHRHP